jgi:hypothetical protein
LSKRRQKEKPEAHSFGTNEAETLKMVSRESQSRKKHVGVFVSYSHDSPSHKDRVREFAVALRDQGINVELDQFHEAEIIDWPRWCKEQTSQARSDFVLCICTAEYSRRIDGNAPPERGKGVYWEGSLLDDDLYDAKGNRRAISVLFDDEPETSIPRFLRGWTFCRVRSFTLTDDGYVLLLRILTGQAGVVKNALGTVPLLPPQSPQSENSPQRLRVTQSYVSLLINAPEKRTCSGRFLVSNKGPSTCEIEDIVPFRHDIQLPKCNLVAVGHWPGSSVNEVGTQKLPISVLVDQPIWVYFRTVEAAELYRGDLPETVILKVFFDCLNEPICKTLMRVPGDNRYNEV